MQNIKTQAHVSGDTTILFRAKPDASSGQLPSDLSRHNFRRFSYLNTAYGIKTTELTSYQDQLIAAVEDLSAKPGDFRAVQKIMTHPSFITSMQREIWPKPEAAIKTGVRSLEEADIERMVRMSIAKALRQDVSDKVRRVVTGIIGVACEHAGLVKLRLHSFTTDVYTLMFPTWASVKEEGVKLLAWEHFKKIELKRGIESKAIGRIALAPLANLFDDISMIIDKIVNERNQFDALAAAAAAKLFRRDEFLGDYRGITLEADVVEFSENATLMLGYLDDLTERGIAITDEFLLSEVRKIPLTSFNRHLTGAAATIRNVPHFRTAPLDLIARNTMIKHVMDYRGGLSGVLISPNFTFGKAEFMVSEFVANTLGRNLIPQTQIEDDLNAVFRPLNDVVTSFPDRIAFVLQNISEQYDAGVALDVSGVDSVELPDGTDRNVEDIIYPLCVGISLSKQYLRLLALAASTNVSVTCSSLRSNSTVPGYEISYVYDIHQPDYNRLLPSMNEGMSFTNQPEVVVAFGTVDSGMAGNWEIASQNISTSARSSRYAGPQISEDGDTANILGDAKNYFERSVSLQLRIPVAQGKIKEFTVPVSFFELFTSTEYDEDLGHDHIYVHFMPAVVAKMRSLISLYLNLNQNINSDGAIITASDRIITMLVDTLEPLMRTPRFRSLVSQVRAQALQTIYKEGGGDRALNNYLRNRLVGGEMDVDIASALIINLLRRAHLVSKEQATDLAELAAKARFRESMLSVVV